jgi:hypothetical protein
MVDKVYESFLRRQYEAGMALTRASDIVALTPLRPPPTQCFVADFHCKGLTGTPEDEIVEANRFQIGIWFPADYLRRVDPWHILTVLSPPDIFHPNIRHAFICVGRLVPGMEIVDLLYQCYEILTWQKVTMREDDALNATACVWARNHPQRFPLDTRPLKRRLLNIRQGEE